LFGANPCAKSHSARRPARLGRRTRRANGRDPGNANSNSAPLENSAVRPTKGTRQREQPTGFCRRLRTVPVVVHATTPPRPMANVTICSSAHERAIATCKLSQRRLPARNSDDYLAGGIRRTKQPEVSPSAAQRPHVLSAPRNVRMSSEKFAALVFLITLARWTSTVRGLMPNSWAMTLFD
jgi:hypothetical protein